MHLWLTIEQQLRGNLHIIYWWPSVSKVSPHPQVQPTMNCVVLKCFLLKYLHINHSRSSNPHCSRFTVFSLIFLEIFKFEGWCFSLIWGKKITIVHANMASPTNSQFSFLSFWNFLCLYDGYFSPCHITCFFYYSLNVHSFPSLCFSLDWPVFKFTYISWDFPNGASGKEPTCQCRRCKRCGFNFWVEKIPWRRACQTTLVFWPGESHGQRSLVGYSPQGCKELDTLKQLSIHAYILYILLISLWDKSISDITFYNSKISIWAFFYRFSFCVKVSHLFIKFALIFF